jgi:peptidoglycan hydrolase-like protein with peptidoglycan-binding domain
MKSTSPVRGLEDEAGTGTVRSAWSSARALGTAALAALALIAGQPGSAQAQPARESVPGPGELSPATIRMLQHSLIQGGYAINAADGVWGPQTSAAVREFQRMKGLKQTGQADAATLEALGVTADGRPRPAADARNAAPEIRTRRPEDLHPATIKAIQQALDKQGFKVGAADGVWGQRTESAIGNFQRARSMPASGELDAHTLAALGLLPAGTERPVPRRAGEPLGAADLDPAAIRIIQQALNSTGYEVGSPDGVWGDRTVRALRDFQRAQGIEPRGEPDVYTLTALGLLPGGATKTTRRP